MGSAPGSSGPSEITVQEDITFGPGPFNFPDPAVGLADLSSYTATLTASFNGSRDGVAYQWSKTYTMLSAKDLHAKQWTITQQGDPSAADSVLQTEMNGLEYEKDGQNPCIANPSVQGDSLSARFEPASMLSGVIGADEAGVEKVNEISASHYTFDQLALGEDARSNSTGELWVATEGSYLVKYVLTKTGGPSYFGEGIDGTLTMEYELTSPNAKLTIALPDDCPPGLVSAPPLPDATDVQSSPGVLSFNSSTSIADATAFYVEQLPPLGWTAQGDPVISDTAAFLNYTNGDQAMTITIEAVEQGSTVTIFVGPNQTSP